MAHLGKTAKQFAAELGIDYVTLFRQRMSEGGVDPNSKLARAANRVFGVPYRYWTDEMPPTVGLTAPVDRAAMEIAALAASRNAPAEMIKALLVTAAPPQAGASWWVRRYLELQDQYRSQ
jgi:hypothetical protein